MNLDMYSLGIIFSLTTWLMLIYITVLWFIYRKEFKGIGTFIISILTINIGVLTLTLQEVIPDFFSIVIGNTLLMLGYALMYHTFCIILKKPLFNIYQIILFVLTVLLFIEQFFFGIISPNLKIRIVIFSFFNSFNFLFMTILFIKERRQLSTPGYFLLVFIVIQLVVSLMRIPITIFSSVGNRFLEATGIQTISALIYTLSMSSWTIGFALLIAEKMRQRAINANEQNLLLMRELSHRTKNNMSLIIALIDWQLSNMSEDINYSYNKMSAILKTIENRIMSMSIVHKKLYTSDDLSSIRLDTYIEELTDYIADSFNDLTDNIKMICDIDPIKTSIETSIHIGLILNELITNSYKHAFSELQTGEINIILKKQNDGKTYLSYTDNGIGFSESDTKAKDGIGFQMIKALGENQLQGTIETMSKNGFSCNIIFSTEIIEKTG